MEADTAEAIAAGMAAAIPDRIRTVSKIGDTIFGPELRLAQGPGYHLHFSPMVSAPTGSVDARPGGVFTHYGMQIGSGTWDFLPSLTYTGRADRLTWGAQVLGIVRMERENESGYRLGDVLQVTG